MKKGLCILLCLSMLWMLCGCTDSAVKELNEGIATIDMANYDSIMATKIDGLMGQYEALSDKQQAKIENLGDLQVAAAYRAIDQIGYIPDFTITFDTLKQKERIQLAQARYNAVPDDRKAEVTNAAELETYADLYAKTEDAYQMASTFAAKLFTRLAKTFKHPESIVLKNAWVYSGAGYHYTFEFEIKNSYGINENVFYGTNIAFLEETAEGLEEELNTRISGHVVLGEGFYFGEGETFAMDHGIALNVAAIDQYFRTHR